MMVCMDSGRVPQLSRKHKPDIALQAVNTLLEKNTEPCRWTVLDRVRMMFLIGPLQGFHPCLGKANHHDAPKPSLIEILSPESYPAESGCA